MFYSIQTVILYLLFVQITYASSLVSLTSISNKLSLGNSHTCIVTTNGGAKCWGSNGGGELGNGTTSFQNNLTPVDVTGLTSNIKTISSGNSYTCALTSAGGVKCWGDNHNGQLGDGTTTRRTTPVDVVGLTSGVKDIFAGYLSTCALTTSGGVKCWGNNQAGQLGNGGVVDSSSNAFINPLMAPYYKSTPSDVIGLTSGVISVSIGVNHACALTTAGAVKCWGVNVNGELGNSAYNSSNTPVNVTGLTSGVVAISSGYEQTCALMASGGIKCWGANYKGQLGDNTTTKRNTPVNVTGLTSGIKSISSGSYHACALTTAGGIKCWGDNSKGQLGDGTITQRISPIDVVGASSGATTIAAGGTHTCLINTGNNVKCWGNNGNGQVGDNTIIQRGTPVTVLTSEVMPCTATIYPNLSVHIPKLESAGTFWWADLAFQPTNDGKLHFVIQNVGVTTTTNTGICATASETSLGNLVVRILSADYGTMKLWVNLVYDAKSSHLILQDYGLLNP